MEIYTESIKVMINMAAARVIKKHTVIDKAFACKERWLNFVSDFATRLIRKSLQDPLRVCY